jgi:hypothetical protein
MRIAKCVFDKIIDVLATQRDEKFKDVPNKLKMIKNCKIAYKNKVEEEKKQIK